MGDPGTDELARVAAQRDLALRTVERFADTISIQRAEIESLRTQLAGVSAELDRALPLARLATWALDTSREDMTDVDGGSLEDSAIELGVLVPVGMKEFCGESCNCTEYFGTDELPITCIRYSDKTIEFIESEKPSTGGADE